MEAFIVHYSKNRQRRQELEADPGLAVFSKVTWIDWYDKDDMFCEWIKVQTGSKLSLGTISNSVKHFEAFRLIVERNLDSAFVFEDDVVFRKDWYQKFLDSGGQQYQFVKLDCLHEIPWKGPGAFRVGNPGGSEARFVQREFAKGILKHADFTYFPDIVHGAYCYLKNLPLMLIPVCAQTSIIEKSSTCEPTVLDLDWRVYMAKFPTEKHPDYNEMHQEYREFIERKRQVETKFFETYGRAVDIKRIEYVYRNEFS